MTPGGARCVSPGAPGFTLVEVLIVVVILGVALGMVSVNLTRDAGSLLEEDGRRLALLLQYARDEAVTRGQALAWTANAEGYRFSRRVRAKGWMPLDSAQPDEVLAAHAWPQPVSVADMRIAGVSVNAGEPLVFSASGLNRPYDLVLASGPWRVALSGDVAGKVRLERARDVRGAPP